MKNTLENAPLITKHVVTRATIEQILINRLSKRLSAIIADKIIEAQKANEGKKAA